MNISGAGPKSDDIFPEMFAALRVVLDAMVLGETICVDGMSRLRMALLPFGPPFRLDPCRPGPTTG
jgi:hypothetical protein